MPLRTYNDVRPWARSIRQRVLRREMPPWGIDQSIDSRRYRNDPSLTEREIDTIVRWVDAGSLEGNPEDLPEPVQSTESAAWTIGEPDLVVTSPAAVVPAKSGDLLAEYVVATGLAEDRYIRAVETRPSGDGQSVVHHALTFLADDSTASHSGPYVSEYGIGKRGDVFPQGTGRLLPAGARLRFRMHYHPAAREITDRTSVGFVLYPPGYVPTYEVVDVTIGLFMLDDDLDIPANSVKRHVAIHTLEKPARIISFQPHMHARGAAMTLTAIHPDGRREILGAVGNYDVRAQTAYAYTEGPVLPAGTILQAAATYDNTAANRRNPDPNQWVGFGNRAADEMLQCHVLLTYLAPENEEPAPGKLPAAEVR
jgi:hypothetical protein